LVCRLAALVTQTTPNHGALIQNTSGGGGLSYLRGLMVRDTTMVSMQ